MKYLNKISKSEPKDKFRNFPLWIFIVVVFAFYFSGQVFRFSFWTISQDFVDESAMRAAEGDIKRRVSFLALGLLGLGLILKYHYQSYGLVWTKLGRLLIALMGLLCLSYFWTVDPALTGRRLVALVTLTIGAVGVTKATSIRQNIILIFSVTFTYLCIGIFAEGFLGNFHPFAGYYRFAGTMHPNSQALNCGLLILSGLALSNDRKEKWSVYSIGVFVGTIFLLLTKSRMGFAATMIGMMVYLNFVTKKTKIVAYLFAIVIILLSLSLILGDLFVPAAQEVIFFGRDADEGGGQNLAGRIPLFRECASYIAGRPVLGYGYGAFWSGDRIEDVSQAVGWPTAGAHSMYLDVALEVGAVGLGLLMAIFVKAFNISRRRWFSGGDAGYAFFCGVFVMVLMNGFLESIFLAAGFVLFVGMMMFLRLAFERGSYGVVPQSLGEGGRDKGSNT